MEVYWFCEHCESTNNYLETKICACGEKIDSKSEEKCIYEMAEQLHETAVSSSDFLTACEYYLKVIDYKDARQKHHECEVKAERIQLCEKSYKKAKDTFSCAKEKETVQEWTEAIFMFGEAEQIFSTIINFSDSKEQIIVCRREKDLCHSKQIYFEAKGIMSSASTIQEYKKAAELFSNITIFADAKENHELCLKFINQLMAEQQLKEIVELKNRSQEEADLDKKIIILKSIVDFEKNAMSGDARKIILQSKPVLDDCLKQKQSIKLQQELDIAMEKCRDAERVTNHTLRAQTFEKIISYYQAYSKTTEFSGMFALCKEKLLEANRNVSYENAIALMNNAKDEATFRKVADAFSSLADFKDAKIKKEECIEKANTLAKKSAYALALEAYEQGQKINIFNWKNFV